jgi:hypothetical protein
MATATPEEAKQLAAIQRKLDRWELIHLRALAASLHEQVEQLESNLERARADAESAWREVDTWRDQVQHLIEELQTTGRTVGLTQAGELVCAPCTPAAQPSGFGGVDIDAVHHHVKAFRDAATKAKADLAEGPNIKVTEGGAA